MQSSSDLALEAAFEQYPTRESIIKLWKDLAKRKYDQRQKTVTGSAHQEDAPLYVSSKISFKKNLYQILPNFDAVAARYGLKPQWLGKRNDLLLDTRNNNNVVATSQFSGIKRGRKTTSLDQELRFTNSDTKDGSNTTPTLTFSSYIPNVSYNVYKKSKVGYQFVTVPFNKKQLPYQGIMSFDTNTIQPVAKKVVDKVNKVIVIDSSPPNKQVDNSANRQSEGHQLENPVKKAKLSQSPTQPSTTVFNFYYKPTVVFNNLPLPPAAPIMPEPVSQVQISNTQPEQPLTQSQQNQPHQNQPTPSREVRNNMSQGRRDIDPYFTSGNTALDAMFFSQNKIPTKPSKVEKKRDNEDPYFSSGNTALGMFFGGN